MLLEHILLSRVYSLTHKVLKHPSPGSSNLHHLGQRYAGDHPRTEAVGNDVQCVTLLPGTTNLGTSLPAQGQQLSEQAREMVNCMSEDY